MAFVYRCKSLGKHAIKSILVLLTRFIPKKWIINIAQKYNSINSGEFDNLIWRVKFILVQVWYYNLEYAEQVDFNKKYIWGTSGDDWNKYKENAYLYQKPEILKAKNRIIEYIELVIKDSHSKYTIFEIGSGPGNLADMLLKSNLNIDYFGFDICQKTIERTKLQFLDTKCDHIFTFINDGWEFAVSMANKISDKTPIFVTHGTLEYFHPQELEVFFKELYNLRESKLVIIEPINIDLASSIQSKPRGGFAYSHNYPFYLKKAGFSNLSLFPEAASTQATHNSNTVSLGLIASK